MWSLFCGRVVVTVTDVGPRSACQKSQNGWNHWKRSFSNRFSNRTTTCNASATCCSSNTELSSPVMTMTMMIGQHSEMLRLTPQRTIHTPKHPLERPLFIVMCYAALPGRPHYACTSLCQSVCPVLTVNSKMEHHTTFNLWGDVTHVRSDWSSNFEVKRLKVKVAGGGSVITVFGAYLCEKVHWFT